MKAYDEFQIGAINKTDIPVAAVVILTPSVQQVSRAIQHNKTCHEHECGLCFFMLRMAMF
jgi:endonuclease V-like protein UPF0215 family